MIDFEGICRNTLLLLLAAITIFVHILGRADETVASARENRIEILVLSSRPDMITGGDALISIDAETKAGLSGLKVFINEREFTSQFQISSPKSRAALVEGIPDSGVLRLVSSEGVNLDTILLKNHPAEGPVFSGPHQKPFICETNAFTLLNGETLGTPVDNNCSIKRRVDYAYLSTTESNLKPLVDPTIRPVDLVYTTTLTGETVPFIVQIETGTANRAIYQISMLYDAIEGSEPGSRTTGSGWNGRLIYTFGGGCVNGWFRQGASTGDVTDPWILGQGYAIASASLNVFGNNCNDVLAAETMMMVKERFIESHGPPLYTIGLGCSGGSYQTHQIADNYPGLLDGIIPGCSFPDVAFSTVMMVTDARLLNHYFTTVGKGRFTKEQQRSISGFLIHESMANVSDKAGRITIGEFCPDVLPEVLRYHPTDNPNGARCEVFEHYVNVYGRDPDTGFVRRPLDNVGVQYGLQALNDGVISLSQFLDLNETIGGYDEEGRFSMKRTEADAQAVRIAYETGRLTSGTGGLATTPIIDYRAYSDDLAEGDIHTRYHSFSMRERIRKANGHTGNHVMLVEDFRYGLYSTKSPVLRDAILQMDQWLKTLSTDTSLDTPKDKVVQAKPPGLVDACWSRDERPVKIVETQSYALGRCNSLYPSPPPPRGIAGAPLASDIVKCQLKPVDLGDYTVSFSSAEIDQLRRIFPTGVCNWSRPGINQTVLRGTWHRFE